MLDLSLDHVFSRCHFGEKNFSDHLFVFLLVIQGLG